MTVVDDSKYTTTGLLVNHNSINNAMKNSNNDIFSQYKGCLRRFDATTLDNNDDETLIFTLSSTDTMDDNGNDDVVTSIHRNTTRTGIDDHGPVLCIDNGHLLRDRYNDNNEIDKNDDDEDDNNDNERDDLTYSSSDKSVNSDRGNCHRITISKENHNHNNDTTLYGPRRRNKTRVLIDRNGNERTNLLLPRSTTRSKKRKENGKVLSVNQHRTVANDTSTQLPVIKRNNSTNCSHQEEVVVKMKQQQEPTLSIAVGWHIEVKYDRSGLWFKLKMMPGGTYMRLFEDEIIDSIQTLVDEALDKEQQQQQQNSTMRFLIKALDGNVHLVDASNVINVLISMIVRATGGGGSSSVLQRCQHYNNFIDSNVASTTATTTSTTTIHSFNQAGPSREDVSSVHPQLPLVRTVNGSIGGDQIGPQRMLRKTLLRKRISTVWSSLSTPYKRKN
jgi:hypothetical protein